MNIVRPNNQLQKVPDPAVLQKFNRLPEIKSVGKMIFDPVWARRMHKSDANEFLYVIRGNVNLRIGKSLIKACPGDTLLVPVGSMHRDDFDLLVGLEVFLVFFYWTAARDYFRLVSFRDVPRLCVPISAEIGKLCDRMQVDLEAGTGTDQLLIGSYTHNILLMILREALRKNEGKNHDNRLHHGRALLFKAREYINLHYAEQVSLDRIAETLRISPFYLSHLFSRESGFSFVEYITQVRMRKAKELISSGAKNVSEAAYAVGYNDGSYFSKVFHRYYGLSPNAVFGGVSTVPKTAKKYPK